MDLLITLIIGFVVGAAAKFLMPGKDPGGFFITALLGVAGSFVASLLGDALGVYATGSLARFAGSVGGAVLVLSGYRAWLARS